MKSFPLQALKSHVEKLIQLGPLEASYCSSSFQLLQVCGQVKELDAGKRVHWFLTRFGSRDLTYSSNLLVQMYGRCGRMVDAQMVFDALQEPNVFSWTMLFSAYAMNGDVSEAGMVFQRMSFRDSVAWSAMISLLVDCRRENLALRLFWRMNAEGVRWTETTLLSIVSSCLVACPQPGLEQELEERCSTWSLSFSNAMITLHSKRGELSESSRIFEGMQDRDVITWNAIIAALIRNDCCERALRTFKLLLLEGDGFDSVTLLMLLEACSALDEGRRLHQLSLWSGALEDDLRVYTALVSMYGRCGDPAAAKQVFSECDQHDVVSCSAMITAYVRNSMHEAGVELFRSIELEGVVKPNEITLSAAMAACSGLRDSHLGELLVEELETMRRASCSKSMDVSGVVIDMYCKCGRIENAKAAFRRSNTKRSLVCWNSMLSGLALSGHEDEAMELWKTMELEGVRGDKATFATILSLWSHSGRVCDAARCLLRLQDDFGLKPSLEHYGCVVDLLARVGLVKEAGLLLGEVARGDEMKSNPKSAEVLWLTVLGACSTQLDVERGKHAAWEIFQANPHKAAVYQLLLSIHACDEYY